MDLLDQAVYETVHSNKNISAKEIATRLGMSHQILLNKANAQNDTHKLSLREALATMLMANDYRIYHAIGTMLEIEKEPSAYDCVLKAFFAASKEQSDVTRAIHESLEDGRITVREQERICKEVDEQIKSLEDLKKTVIEIATNKSLKAVG